MTIDLFLNRNPEIRSEMTDILSRPYGVEIGRSKTLSEAKFTKFNSLGSFYSELCCEDLYGGIKTLKTSNQYQIKIYFLNSLANLLLLEELNPDISSMSPRFFLGLLDTNGDFIGYLMEDYSKSNQDEISQMSPNQYHEIPPSIRDLMEEDIKELTNVFCQTSSGIKLMDIECLPWKQRYNDKFISLLGRLEFDGTALEPHIISI